MTGWLPDICEQARQSQEYLHHSCMQIESYRRWYFAMLCATMPHAEVAPHSVPAGE